MLMWIIIPFASMRTFEFCIYVVNPKCANLCQEPLCFTTLHRHGALSFEALFFLFQNEALDPKIAWPPSLSGAGGEVLRC